MVFLETAYNYLFSSTVCVNVNLFYNKYFENMFFKQNGVTGKVNS